MKTLKKSMALAILIAIIISVIASVPVSATSSPAAGEPRADGSNYKQKVVGVVYDNSGSMDADMGDGLRATAAKYALQMLISLLSDDDIMFIMPMNDGEFTGDASKESATATKDDIINVNFKDANGNPINRQTAIDNTFKNKKLRIVQKAGTPDEPIGIAIEEMKSKYGLVDNDSTGNTDREYWLLILNDGNFDKCNPPYNQSPKNVICNYVTNYTNLLNTVCASFGAASALSSDPSVNFTAKSLNSKSTPEDLAKAVQDIANLISGRYTLENNTTSVPYTVTDNSITVNLDQLNFPLSSLSVVAQNCNATVKTVVYQSSSGNVTLSKDSSCTLKTQFRIDPHWSTSNSKDVLTSLKAGSSCRVTPPDDYFSGGKIVFTYSFDSSDTSKKLDKSKISVFVEPALELDFDILDQSGNTVTATSFQQGDKIKVRYKIINPSTKQEVELKDIFPGTSTTASVVYNNTTYKINDISSKTSEIISLVQGNKSLMVNVNANDGKYVLRQQKSLAVSAKGFSVKANGNSEFSAAKDAIVNFQVFVDVNNTPTAVTKAELSDYKFNIQVTTNTSKKLANSYKINDDNTVTVTVKTTELTESASSLKVFIEVVSPENAKTSTTHEMSYTEPPFHVTVQGEKQFADKKNTASATFAVILNEKQLNANQLKNYTIDITAESNSGYKVSVKHTIDNDGNIVATITAEPNKFDVYTVKCKVTAPASLDGITAEKSFPITYTPTSLELNFKENTPESITLSQHKFKDNTQGFSFVLTANGMPFPFNSDSSKYKLTVAGVEITDATITGDDKGENYILSFIPTADNIAEILKTPGDKNVVLKILNQDPALSPEITAKLTVKETKFVIVPPAETTISLSESKALQNTTGFTFSLTTTEGEAYPFGTDITKFTLKVGNKEITEYTLQDNTLTFIPDKNTLGDLMPGVKEIVLSLTNGNDSKTVIFEIIKSNYDIVLLPESITTVDRFNLQNTDAVLYFKIICDGEVLPESALELIKDEIVVEKAFAFKNFMLPCSLSDLEVTTVNNTPALAIRMMSSMPVYFDWHYSAFITDGEKNVTLSYRDAVPETAAFNFVKSPIFQHILRITLLILVHIFIIYLIIYIVGFFIVKRLPTGVFIVVRASGASMIVPVNMTLWKKYGWHLTRFVTPWKVLSHQSLKGQVPSCAGMKFINQKGRIKAKIERANCVFPVSVSYGIATDLINQFHSAIEGGNTQANLKAIIRKNAPGLDGTRLFAQSGTAQPAASFIDVNSYSYYGYYRPAQGGRGTFSYAVRFTKINNNRRRRR